MTKFINPGLTKTSRRNVLRGSVLAGAAAMAGAGARALADGFAKTPSDIDMVAIHGLGFARRTGGVMFAADLLGLEKVHSLLMEMTEVSHRIPVPSPVFKDLVRANQTFTALDS